MCKGACKYVSDGVCKGVCMGVYKDVSDGVCKDMCKSECRLLQ